MVGPVYTRPVPQGTSATHAFIIGVGAYPHARYNQGVKEELRNVRDLPSAADSARYMVDWLIDNKDMLAAPLASIHLLISEPTGLPANLKRYTWRNPLPYAPADSTNVAAEGVSWVNTLTARPGDVALFYACGHGGSLSTEPVLFLEDLNKNIANPWAHHNIGATALGFKQLPGIKAGFFFADTCREFLAKFELGRAQDLSRFVAPFDPFNTKGQEKISLICGTSDTQLSYEGKMRTDPNIRLGRFTQILTKALEGASARQKGNQWVVHNCSLNEDLKTLGRLYWPEWRDQPFEPSPAITANEAFPFTHPPDPMLPMVIFTDPEAAAVNYNLRIFDNAGLVPPALHDKGPPAPVGWPIEVKAGVPYYIVAGNGAPPTYQQLFIPSAPNFDYRITVA